MNLFNWLFGRKKQSDSNKQQTPSKAGGLLAEVQDTIDRITVAAGFPKGTTIPYEKRSKLDSSLVLELMRAEHLRDQIQAEVKSVQDVLRDLDKRR